MSSPFGHSLRSRFVLRDTMTFLNNGSFGATPRTVLEAQQRWQLRLEQQPLEFVKRVLPVALRSAAARMASFMNAEAEDLVFVENASTGVSNVLHSLIPKLKAGDELLTTSHVYNAMRQCMKHICSLTHAVYREVDVPFPTESSDQVRRILRDAITDRTRFVLIDHVTSPTGLVFPVADIVKDCHESGVLVLIDGAHAPGMLPIDLQAIDADWYTGNFHKWLFAPKGSAFLWTKKEHQPWMHPVVISHGYMQGYLAEFDYLGTKDWSSYTTAVDGLEFMESLGVDAVRSYNNALALRSRELMLQVLPQPEPAPASMLTSLATIVLPLASDDAFNDGEKIHDQLWDDYGIEVPVFPFGNRLLLRTASQVFNEESDTVVLCNALKELFPHA